jgi:hypothetical protein
LEFQLTKNAVQTSLMKKFNFSPSQPNEINNFFGGNERQQVLSFTAIDDCGGGEKNDHNFSLH